MIYFSSAFLNYGQKRFQILVLDKNNDSESKFDCHRHILHTSKTTISAMPEVWQRYDVHNIGSFQFWSIFALRIPEQIKYSLPKRAHAKNMALYHVDAIGSFQFWSIFALRILKQLNYRLTKRSQSLCFEKNLFSSQNSHNLSICI